MLRILKILFITLIIISFQKLISSEISIDSYVDKTEIGLQDYLKLTIEISGEDADKVKEPDVSNIKHFRNFGSSTSSSSSYSIINGKMQSEIIKSYIYTLKPQKIGKFVIPSITIKYKKQKLATKPITITVVKGSTEPAPPTSRKFQRRDEQTSGQLSDNLFITAETSKRTVYKDQPITVEYKLFTRYDIANLAFEGEPNFNGFWKEDVFIANSINFNRVNRNGIIFNVMNLRKVALFPTQTGNIQIPPIKMNVDIRTQSRSFFDFGSTKSYSINSKPITINVIELPKANRPLNYSGAVGNFQVSSKLSSNEMKVGDSFTFTLEISGSGNLKHFELPQLPEIKHLRFIEPEITTQISSNKITGSKTIKYLVIAQEKGAFSIPSIEFSFFDPEKKQYITKSTKTYDISVLEGTSIYIPSTSAQSFIEIEGTDITFIINNTKLKTKIIYLNSVTYWLIIIIVLLTIPASMIYAKEQEKLSGNIAYLRQKRANRILRKYLKKSTESAKNSDIIFYASTQIGLSSFLADKLRIPRGSSSASIISQMKTKSISDELITKIESMFEKCNQARFMPGGFSEKNIQNDFRELQEIVNEISKEKI